MDKKKIILVEDEAIVAEDLRRNLERLGYEVVAVAASGEQALVDINTHRPDLVLMDIVLQGDLSGIDTAEIIRQQEHLPVIYLTAHSDPVTLERAKISEPYGYVLKPFDERELHSIIEITLYKHQAEKRLHHINGILRAIRNVNQLIVQEKDRDRLIDQACRLLTEGRGYFNAYIALVTEGGQVMAAAAAGADIDAYGVTHIVQSGALPECMRRAWEQQVLLAIEDHLAECSACPLFHHGDRAALVTPLVYQDHCYGVLGVLLPAAMGRDQEELELFQEVAADLALALYKMDIEERERRSRAALEESLSLYRATLDATADGLQVVDRQGRIISFNRKFLEMWRIPEDIIESRDDDRVLEFVLDQLADPQGFLDKVRDLYGRPEMESFDRIYFKDGRVFERFSSPQYLDDQIVGRVWSFRNITFMVKAEKSLQKYQTELENLVRERTAALVAANAELNREISEHKQTEKALRESEARFRAIFEGAPIGISLQDHQGRVLAVNPALHQILGGAPGENGFGDSLHPDDSEAFHTLVQDLAEGGRDHFMLEHRVFRQNGDLVWLRVHLSKIKGTDDQPWFTLSLIEDITREKKVQAEINAYQERLRAMAAKLTMTEERERRRLAADLHDNIGQMLALLQIKLGSLRQEISSPQGADDLDEARTFLAQIIKTTRSLTLEMGLSVLHELGFESGVEWLGEKFHEQYGLQVEVECDSLPPSLGSVPKTLFFRVIRELLTNVVKHAQAQSARVSVRAAGDQFCLQVADDGVGFEMSNLSTLAGFGLFSIAERISNQGGKMEVNSTPGEGTEVTLTLPLTEEPPLSS
jgi:PAS domain S-box-containing protein